MTTDKSITHPITWKQVNDYVSKNELYNLRRSPEQTLKYHKHRDSLKGINVTEFILQKLHWNLDELENLNSIKFKTDDEKTKACFSNSSLYQVTLNDFPYFFEPNVVHLLVWSKIRIPMYKNDETEKHEEVDHIPEVNGTMKNNVETFLEGILTDKYHISKDNYCWFMNYTKLQSIRSISHLHVLIRLEDIKDEHDKNVFVENLMNNFK
ncbi:GIG1 family protein NDAI_0B04410 [Naumovozyma dairenensis CBS 421]|uniref:Uncharacterized protein n=1 Tax=Naumovozyma dairenensis (strain ATCC 10597 / BCRC 20456 / CBS 421 / NBRC 0211 / NRRL Y-12639) TaxID=1071378 RepID=G0W6R4_NAUDC|nr:hypothetical protein NDAI_0B04410 [Naumovozyma dairenensis CBS 421]CCD23475.1 hypothetical protein NDAI_0B04410 [Naumovozyma dairenensis CBS 421]